jgi:hypothetical protein
MTFAFPFLSATCHSFISASVSLKNFFNKYKTENKTCKWGWNRNLHFLGLPYQIFQKLSEITT